MYFRLDYFALYSEVPVPVNIWHDKWEFQAFNKKGNKTIRFKAELTNDVHPYRLCLGAQNDGIWRKINILEKDLKDFPLIDFDPAYYVQGAYIYLLMSGNMCDIYDAFSGSIKNDRIEGQFVSDFLGGSGVFGAFEAVRVDE